MLTSIGRISGRTIEKKVRIGPAPQTREECSSSIRDLADRCLHHVNADRHLGDDHDQDQRSQAAVEKRQQRACQNEPEHRYAEQDSGDGPRQPGQQVDDAAARQPRAHDEVGDDGVDQHAAEACTACSAAASSQGKQEDRIVENVPPMVDRVGRGDVKKPNSFMNEPQTSMSSGQSSETATTRNRRRRDEPARPPMCSCRKLAPRPRTVAYRCGSAADRRARSAAG